MALTKVTSNLTSFDSLLVDSDNTNTTITIESDLDGSSNFSSGIDFVREGEAKGSRIESVRDASAGGVGLKFLTTADNAAEVSGTLTEQMRLDRSGNVMIGTTTASGKLNVNGDINFLGRIRPSGTGGNGSKTAPSICPGYDNDSGFFQPSSNVLAMSLGGTERVRYSGGDSTFTSDEDVITNFYNGAGSNTGWGGNVAGYFASVRGGTNTPMYVSHSSTGSGEFINFLQSTTSRGTISYNGSVMVYGGTSDYRLKENVVDLPNATTRLNALRPVNFDWIETGENSEGFLAHEVQAQVPYAVQGTHNELYTEDGVGEEQANLVGEPKYQQVDYGKLTPLLVKALQEANAKIEALETRIETLENA